ncbi:Na(+)/H(+) antiporter subunit F1 [Alkalicoccus daliensis]|uniref:Multisubunit sodium/proton antiporter, MrpF subunit (TC 2.A.63.1) n=1 Tax=Alkalicoccus daliensis TaxID=745820 RepID=A0A1H0BGP1_9BACI|nr:Na(+)/H(+) antiporter subunit F1 [Alkalicoccus daliensis]SDN44807.1 multisubunit sodium/proton antiporter, MrpF subunit (TC 2.A.63.1) [Alkalicoccus daliensis]
MVVLASYITLGLLSVSVLLCIIRLLKGPSMADRVVALDTIGLNLIGFIGVIMIVQQTILYSEALLIIAILAFISTVSFAKFLEGGVVIDR